MIIIRLGLYIFSVVCVAIGLLYLIELDFGVGMIVLGVTVALFLGFENVRLALWHGIFVDDEEEATK